MPPIPQSFESMRVQSDSALNGPYCGFGAENLRSLTAKKELLGVPSLGLFVSCIEPSIGPVHITFWIAMGVFSDSVTE